MPTGLDWTHKYPAIAAAVAMIGAGLSLRRALRRQPRRALRPFFLGRKWPTYDSTRLGPSSLKSLIEPTRGRRFDKRVENAPVFHSLRFPQEVDRLFSIAAVANSFKPPTEPTKGITMDALMESLGPPLVLNLEKGKDLLS